MYIPSVRVTQRRNTSKYKYSKGEGTCIPVHVMIVYVVGELQLHAFVTSTLD